RHDMIHRLACQGQVVGVGDQKADVCRQRQIRSRSAHHVQSLVNGYQKATTLRQIDSVYTLRTAANIKYSPSTLLQELFDYVCLTFAGETEPVVPELPGILGDPNHPISTRGCCCLTGCAVKHCVKPPIHASSRFAFAGRIRIPLLSDQVPSISHESMVLR